MSNPHTLTITGAGLGDAMWPADTATARKASAQLAMWIHAVVDARVFVRGVDAMMRLHKPYSQAYRKWKLKRVGGFIAGPEVNLQLKGMMRRQFRPKNIRATSGDIGPTGSSRRYAVFVDELRPWIELSRTEVDAIPEVAARIAERLNRAKKTGPAAGGSIV